MKIAFILSLLIGASLLTLVIIQSVEEDYQFSLRYQSLWSLADKASTIEAKEVKLTQFIAALRAGKAAGEFSDNNAIFLKTPDNNFDANFRAVSTLADRLAQIQSLDPSSFQYNTAIQQITSQEQGEAKNLLQVIEGCYCLKNYPLIWGWVGLIAVIAICISIFAAIIFGDFG